MTRLALLAAAALLIPAAGHASTFFSLNGDSSAFRTGTGASASSINTTSSLGNQFDPISSVRLIGGTTISLSGSSDVVDQPGLGDAPFSNGYTGQVVDSTTGTETLTFSRPVANFGLTIQPDVGLFGSAVSLTFTLSDGNSSGVSSTFKSGNVVFFGFVNEPVTSLTITTSTPDFAFGQFLTVPEPTSMLLLGTALIPLLRRRTRR